MIERFKGWIDSHRQALNDYGVAVDFTQCEEFSPAAVANLDSKSFLASITIWEFGACDVHMLDVETGSALILERYDVESFDELGPVLDDVYTRFTYKES